MYFVCHLRFVALQLSLAELFVLNKDTKGTVQMTVPMTTACTSQMCRGQNVSRFPQMSSTNFEECLATIKANDTLWRTGGTDLNGNLVANSSQVLGMTYRMCVSQCGSTPEAFRFSSFSTQFTSFMLPFLALTAQLPFGAANHADNFSSIVLTIGSPTLAIFSLLITVLNSRWLRRRFARIAYYPNTNHAVKILDNLQESLLRVEKTSEHGGFPLLASLIILPQNDQWWQCGEATLAFTHTWSMANIASVGWAIIAFIFTIASMDKTTMNIIGPAVACAWIYLLPLVVGWLQTSPNCDEAKLRAKMASLNETVYIPAPGTGNSPPAAGPVVLARNTTDECAIEVWPPRRHGMTPQGETNSDICDESRSPPFFNFARMFSWPRSVELVAVAFEAAAFRASKRQTVDGSEWTTVQGGDPLDPSNRSGDASAVAQYIEPADPQPLNCWAPEVWNRIIYSGIIACAVQWSGTGSAVLAAYMTPTVGLGCHSASFVLHGVLSNISFFIILLGVLIQQRHHCTNPLSYAPDALSRGRSSTLSVSCRRIGKILAWSNAFIFISLCLLRFANIFDNCFCGSSVLGLGTDRAFQTVAFDPSMHFLSWWIAATIVATLAAFAFWISIFVLGHKS
ncbi:hypothetical protein C8R44DRAFT_847287 [Mycena epipterygia]|nr:hypothetical protein C8R44DRAFT_847287 [Mycena epipterygia]